jgi:hypothetical protein
MFILSWICDSCRIMQPPVKAHRSCRVHTTGVPRADLAKITGD